jgi:hypothetical protein
MERENDHRSRRIKEATSQYVYNRWRAGLPGLIYILPFILMAAVHSFLPDGSDSIKDLSRGWQWALLAAHLALLAGILLWSWWLVFRGGWRRLLEWPQRDAGVVVEKVRFRRVSWWVWPLAFVVGPACFVGITWQALKSPVQFQPLALALGITAFGAGISRIIPRQSRAYFRPVHFLWWGLYCCYALAAALGMPQPWGRATDSWGSALRLAGPMVLLGAVDIAAREVYSRRQLRRLQSLAGPRHEEGGRGAG